MKKDPQNKTLSENLPSGPDDLASFEQKALMFEELLEGYQVIDRDWTYLYLNKTALKHSKKKKDELLGKKFPDVWPGIENTEIYRLIKDAILHGNSHQTENLFVYPDGTEGWFELRIQPIAEGILILSIDITKRKLLLKTVEEDEQRFRSVFEVSNVAKSITSLDGQLMVNQAFSNLVGYTQEELNQKPWQEITHPDDIQKTLDNIGKLLDGTETDARFNKRYIHKNGSIVWADLNAVIHFSPEGKPLYFVTTILDITEQIENRKQRKEQERLLRQFIENSPASIAMFDTNMVYIMTSRRYRIDFNLPDESLVGKSHYDVFPEMTDEHREIHQRCLHGEILKESEAKLLRVDGSVQWLRWELHPWYKGNSEIGGIIFFSEIITDLVEARKKAMESDRLKSIFLANMSHEIRTPLNAILGFSSLIASEETDQQERIEYEERINDAGQNLLRIISDIIDISKLEADQFSINLKNEAIYPIVKNIYHEFVAGRQLSKNPRLNLELNFPSTLRAITCNTDRNRLQQVLNNLITNAIKFTKNGVITISATPVDLDNRAFLQISVKDTGKGIPEQQLELVFERFRQVEENQFHEGSGLGLSIAKGIVEKLGGTIGVKSTLGVGSEFYFNIPIDDPVSSDSDRRKESIHRAKPADKKVTIYIAEDDEYSYILLSRLLESPSTKIVHAENGKALLSLLEEETPDLLLLDINMPAMSGLECLQEIRNRKLKMKIIAQTGYAMTGDRERFLEAGCDAYISKPINKDHLYKTISEVMDW